MTKTVKQTLILLLITSLALLPLRAAFAMQETITDSPIASDHCKNMKMDMSHDMSSMNTTDDDSSQMKNGACCDKCDNDCNHCMSTVSFIETDTIPNLNHQSETFYRFSFTSVQTRELSPPFRPPATPFI